MTWSYSLLTLLETAKVPVRFSLIVMQKMKHINETSILYYFKQLFVKNGWIYIYIYIYISKELNT